MKAKLTKTIHTCVYKDGEQWNVQFGELKRHKGNPGKTAHLFRVIGEKLPFEALSFVRKHIQQHELGFKTDGVYVAHDSMGFPRYIGRGAIFDRLKARKDAQELELAYFSFYVEAASPNCRDNAYKDRPWGIAKTVSCASWAARV